MNERMTKRDTDGQAMMDCENCKAEWTGKHGKPIADCTALYCRNRLLGRVVEYEDTGWTPKAVTALGELFNYALKESKTLTEQLTLLKHIRELAEADKDGRLVVLPCKVGQRVFALLDTDKHISECEVKQIGLGNEIGFVGIEPIGARGREYGVSIKGFGKTVFLTREAAEAALEAMKNGNS